MDNKRPKSRFQSTLPRRERLPATPKLEHFRYFNPRSREGSDRIVSYFSAFSPRFQSTLPRRERQGCNFLIRVSAIFQSTLPRRERLWISYGWLKSKSNFNPRSREGSDQQAFADKLGVKRFQSTLPRRERPKRSWSTNLTLIFQSTLPRRERPHICSLANYAGYFNPRSREGSDSIPAKIRLQSTKFQSTLPRRERHADHLQSTYEDLISIHAPAKGATAL